MGPIIPFFDYKARVLDFELKPGDEVAIKPGKNSLSYRGPHFPITDMIYFTSGMGIVPILHQAKAILPMGSSSVKMVSIIWMNDDARDFDIAFKELEEEYFKYNMKLEVSCVIHNAFENQYNDITDSSSSSSMDNNQEIDNAIPTFRAGTMAVISGPKAFVNRASEYLMNRKEYPEDCLCSLV